MTDGDGLRALQVCIARHRRVRLGLGPVEHRAGEALDRFHRLPGRVLDVEPEGGRDLVVARAAGVDLAADLAQQAFDRRVDVFVLIVSRASLDRRQEDADLR